MKLDTTIWFIAVFLSYWALNVSIREAMTLKIIRKLARSMIYIYLFQLIIIRSILNVLLMKHKCILKVRRWISFDIYWQFIYSINIIGFTPSKKIHLWERLIIYDGQSVTYSQNFANPFINRATKSFECSLCNNLINDL